MDTLLGCSIAWAMPEDIVCLHIGLKPQPACLSCTHIGLWFGQAVCVHKDAANLLPVVSVQGDRWNEGQGSGVIRLVGGIVLYCT